MMPHLVALLPLQNTEVSHNLLLAKKLKKKKKYRKEKEKKRRKFIKCFVYYPTDVPDATWNSYENLQRMNTLITSLKLPPPPPAAVDGRKHSPYLWKFIFFVQVKTSILKLHRRLTCTLAWRLWCEWLLRARKPYGEVHRHATLKSFSNTHAFIHSLFIFQAHGSLKVICV